MKTILEINLDYAKAIRQAEQLEAIARNLGTLADSEFQGCLQRISTNWKGENASAYIAKGQKLKGDMNKTAEQLNKAAGAIRNIARRTKEADIAAMNIALSSGG